MIRAEPEEMGLTIGRPRRHRRSIRTSLVALVTACVIPSIGALAIMVHEDHAQREDAVLRETQLRARGLMATVDRDLAKVEASLQVLAASNRLASADLASFADRLRTTPRSPVVLNYVVIDPSGRQLLNAAAADATLLPTASSEVLRVFTTGEPVISGLAECPLHRQWCITLTVPVRQNGEIVYGLTAELAPAQFGRLLENAALPDAWTAVLVDGAGRIVARSKDGRRLTGQTVGTDLRDDLVAHAEGSLDGTSKDGTTVLTAHTRSSLSNLSIVINAPRSALDTQLSSSLVILIGGGALVLGLALWCALRIAGDVRRSVEGLIAPALALGSGRTVELPETALQEADDVGRAIAEAARMLALANHQARHDPLTGLCNRVLFDEVATQRLAAAQRSGEGLAVLAIDLDGFKAVNDRHGHATGDAVLRIAAERIGAAVRPSDIVSRRGGDEFTVLLGEIDPLMTREIGRHLVTALALPYPGVAPSLSGSVGIALFPHDGLTLGELLARADEALYAAKKGGKRRMAGAEPLSLVAW